MVPLIVPYPLIGPNSFTYFEAELRGPLYNATPKFSLNDSFNSQLFSPLFLYSTLNEYIAYGVLRWLNVLI